MRFLGKLNPCATSGTRDGRAVLERHAGGDGRHVNAEHNRSGDGGSGGDGVGASLSVGAGDLTSFAQLVNGVDGGAGQRRVACGHAEVGERGERADAERGHGMQSDGGQARLRWRARAC